MYQGGTYIVDHGEAVTTKGNNTNIDNRSLMNGFLELFGLEPLKK